VCDRVVIIDQGKLLLDDTLQNLKTKYIRKKILTIALEAESIVWDFPQTKVIERSPHHLKIEVDVTKLAIDRVVAKLLENHVIKDLSIEGPPLETIIQNLYKHGTELSVFH
jgi:ABC-2 type transport system ATP-binding protein